MNTAQWNGSATTFTETLRGAIRYWELRRLPYNLALTAVFVAWLAWAPHFGPFTQQDLLALFVLALLANACYFAAYAVELVMNRLHLWESWQSKRWILWLAGTLFAVALEYYWIADEIYPQLH
ncbi:MAG: hypothetical protein ACRES7_07325 [Gammaproteobacteria bacterium]